MKLRSYWLDLLEKAWQERSVIWLSGVRRAGKTCLCQSLGNVEYFDCELPRTRRMMADPEGFLGGLRGRRVVLDEVHRLTDPSELLKIAADHFPDIQIIATGSSTLGASTKFRDTLSGRKVDVWLTPMMSRDLDDFGADDLPYRLLHGGLPPFFLADPIPEREFQEWMDAYWAKDIQELFRLERRHAFQHFTELILMQSGGMFEASRFSRSCEVSRSTISNYLKVLEATHVAFILRPFSTHKPTEIVAAPKVYGFDTGFVCYFRGWDALRPDDLGQLWEHYVLNEMYARLQVKKIHYWRDKRGHEVDFILKPRGKPPIALECKWQAGDFKPGNLQSFNRQYPAAVSYVVATDVDRAYQRRYREMTVHFSGLAELMQTLKSL